VAAAATDGAAELGAGGIVSFVVGLWASAAVTDFDVNAVFSVAAAVSVTVAVLVASAVSGMLDGGVAAGDGGLGISLLAI
jgi:hypothetical protein